jgi:hypothetical protein
MTQRDITDRHSWGGPHSTQESGQGGSGGADCQESHGHEETVIDMKTGDSALYLLANVRGTANCIHYDSTAKHSRVRTPSMLCTIPGFANRGSSDMYRPALPRGGVSCPRSVPSSTPAGRTAVPALGRRRRVLAACPVGRSRFQRCRAQRRRRLRFRDRSRTWRTQDRAVTAVAALQQALTKKAGRAEAQIWERYSGRTRKQARAGWMCRMSSAGAEGAARFAE